MQTGWICLLRGLACRAAATGLLAVALASAAWADQWSDTEKQAVGAWYGEFAPAPGKPIQRFINNRAADGTYTLHARLYDNGKMISELRNIGLWGISNGMYFTVTTSVNGNRTDLRAPDVTNAYLVQKSGVDEFEYIHVASGNRFRVVRVDTSTAKLPD